jgi:hypothetical protein
MIFLRILMAIPVFAFGVACMIAAKVGISTSGEAYKLIDGIYHDHSGLLSAADILFWFGMIVMILGVLISPLRAQD